MAKRILIAGLVPVFALALTAAPALGFWWGGDDVNVSNSNGASVHNIVTSSANSGGNTANGGSAGGAGNGGSVWFSDDDNTGGNGGAGGDGGNGGSVTTGTAGAYTNILNQANTNDTRVNLCGCEDDNDGDTNVRNRNWAHVGNVVYSGANSGDNNADGGSADGEGGNGGKVFGSDDDNRGGNGGSAGDAGDGGTVRTGLAGSESWITNILNSNLTRVTR